MSAAQQRALDTLLPRFGLPFAPQAIDFDRVFGRVAPRVLEIGCGMGETTARIARAMPGVDFVGVEVHAPGVGSLLKLVAEQALTNLRVIRHDAVEVVAAMIPPHSLAGIHVFFPDPWPKKRHHKRRLLKPAFVHELALRLALAAICTSPRTGGVRARDPRDARRRAAARECGSRLRAAPGLPAADQVRGARARSGSRRVGRDLPPPRVARGRGRSGGPGDSAAAREGDQLLHRAACDVAGEVAADVVHAAAGELLPQRLVPVHARDSRRRTPPDRRRPARLRRGERCIPSTDAAVATTGSPWLIARLTLP